MILAAGAFLAGAVAIGITFAILRWLFGDLRLLS